MNTILVVVGFGEFVMQRLSCCKLLFLKKDNPSLCEIYKNLKKGKARECFVKRSLAFFNPKTRQWTRFHKYEDIYSCEVACTLSVLLNLEGQNMQYFLLFMSNLPTALSMQENIY